MIYTDKKQKNYIIREFGSDIDEIDLMWHRDETSRTVSVIGETDWKIQIDNELPRTLDIAYIPKGVYHRLIKGNGKLSIKIINI